MRNSYRDYCASNTLEVACPAFITLILTISLAPYGFVLSLNPENDFNSFMDSRRLPFYFSCIAGASIWFSFGDLFADEPIVLYGGLSPNGRLSVVVGKDNNWYSSGPESAVPSAGELDDSKAYLYDEISRKVIGPLEEVDTMAGGFGTSLSNVKALWSADSRFLAISFRSGALVAAQLFIKFFRPRTLHVQLLKSCPPTTQGQTAKIFFPPFPSSEWWNWSGRMAKSE